MGQVIPFIARVGSAGDFSAADRARLAELAERYAAAGVRVEVIYGATEDGDPWCVVKDENEEVLIHVARIGDGFVVHYALDDALRQGQDLRSVLRERLAWEDRPEVVVPFSRQAQSLLALIVAASFLHETAKPGDDSPPPLGFQPLDEHLGQTVAAAADIAPADPALAGTVPTAEAAGLATLGGAGATTIHPAVWRDVADEAPLRLDHADVQFVRFTPGGPPGAVANLEVAAPRAPDAPTPIVMAFDAHPRVPAATTEASTTSTFAPTTLRKTDEPPTPEPPPKTALVATHWVEVDTNGDGRPDTRVLVPDEPKADRAELAAADHAAILAVGHALPHHEIV